MYKFGIYTNFKKDITLVNTRKVISALEELNCEIYLDSDLFEVLKGEYKEGVQNADYLFVLGGDGTILSAARKYASYSLNIIGVNLGRVGFLAEIAADEVKWAAQQILCGKYTIEERFMLEANSKDFTEKLLALNDFVISPRNIPRMVNAELKINNFFAEKYYCDGVIVSSPTGSTGYTISAGGPIVSPSVKCILVTPVCAHTLNARSIVLNDTDVVEVRLLIDGSQAYVTADGQYSKRIEEESSVIIKKSAYSARFVRVKDSNFFALLKVKLAQWQTNDQ